MTDDGRRSSHVDREELRRLIALSLPIALAQLGWTAMHLVDTAILGRSSSLDLAAATTARSIMFAAASLGMGLALSLEPIAAQAIGAGEHARAWGALRASLVASLLVSLPTIGLTFATTLLLAPLGADPALTPLIRSCLVGQAPGILAFFLFLAGKTYLQAKGETLPSLVASIIANVVNVFVCMLLVRGDVALKSVGLPAIGLPALGAFGAGLASSVASTVLAAWVLGAAYRGRPKEPRVVVSLGTITRIGLPLGLQLLAEIGVFAVVSLIAGRFGSTVVSAHQIALGLASFTFMAALGVSGATAVRVGHAVGEGVSPRRRGVLGLGLGALSMCTGALMFALFPRQLVALFTHDQQVIDVGSTLVRIAAVFQLFDGVQVVAAGALRGIGDVRYPFLAQLGAHWGVGLPVALVFGIALKGGAVGLWVGLTLGLVTVAIVMTRRFLRRASERIERV